MPRAEDLQEGGSQPEAQCSDEYCDDWGSDCNGGPFFWVFEELQCSDPAFEVKMTGTRWGRGYTCCQNPAMVDVVCSDEYCDDWGSDCNGGPFFWVFEEQKCSDPAYHVVPTGTRWGRGYTCCHQLQSSLARVELHDQASDCVPCSASTRKFFAWTRDADGDPATPCEEVWSLSWLTVWLCFAGCFAPLWAGGKWYRARGGLGGPRFSWRGYSHCTPFCLPTLDKDAQLRVSQPRHHAVRAAIAAADADALALALVGCDWAPAGELFCRRWEAECPGIITRGATVILAETGSNGRKVAV
jgi:hypothetical protein